MAAIMTTPDRHTQSNASRLMHSPSARSSLPTRKHITERASHTASRQVSAPHLLNRQHTGVPASHPVTLSIGPSKRVAGELRRVRPMLPARHSSHDLSQPPTRPPPSSSGAKHEATSCLPAVRRSELSPRDLNAPKPKRRSIDFEHHTPLPRLVLSPAEPKPLKSRSSGSRLPAPIFTSVPRPELRRANTHTTDLRTEWSDSMSRNSANMTRLSLCEGDLEQDDGERLFGTPGPSDVARARHRRSRSGDALKRLSLPKALDDVFDSSSSPHAAITPSPQRHSYRRPLSHPPVVVADEGPSLFHSDDPIPLDSFKPRSDSLPDFILPIERGIAKKRSNVADVHKLTVPAISHKVSRLSERLRPRDSGLAGFSFEGERERSDEADVDISFASMTSLGSPVKEPTLTLPSDASFKQFVEGLDGNDQAMPGPFVRLPSPAVNDLPMVTPGFGPEVASGWPGFPMSSESEDEGEIDMDSVLFATMQAKQGGRASMPNPSTRLHMPDTPVKHAGRPSLPAPRQWQTTSKPVVDKAAHFNAPRKSLPSLPSKFTPQVTRTSMVVDSPDSDGSGFSPQGKTRSPSPTLRTRGAVGTAQKPSSGLGLGMPPRPSLLSHQHVVGEGSPTLALPPTSIFAQTSPVGGSDLLSGMGITKRRADLMRRTSSSAWSFSSESSSDGGLATPSRSTNAADTWLSLSPIQPMLSAGTSSRKVSFIETSPLMGRSSGRLGAGAEYELPSPPSINPRRRDTLMRSAEPSPPVTPLSTHFNGPFHRQPSPLPTPLHWSDSDDEGCNDGVVLDFGIKEERFKFETEFVCEEQLGTGSFGQAFRVASVYKSTPSGKAKLYAIKKSKPYEGAKHRLRLLEEFDILRHLSSGNTPRRSRSVSLSWPSAPMEAPNVNVLHFVHAWEQDSMLCIQTELCELGNLSDFLFEFGSKYNRLDEPRIWKVLSEIGNGILHIHHQNIIHLDLKPANIFITIEGRLRIGDYGMASRWPRPASFGDDGAQHSLDREGDREYMAPEILGGRYGREADIFSFGMIMLECAGNIVVPSMGEPWSRLRQHDFSDVDLSGLTPTLIDMITRLMHPQPSARPLIDQICGHDIVLKTRSIMLQNIETVRRASAALMNGASLEERDAAREAANVALFKASALGTEDDSFFQEVFAGSDNSFVEDEAMDTAP